MITVAILTKISQSLSVRILGFPFFQVLLDFLSNERKQKLAGEFLVRFSVDFPAVTYFHNQYDE